EREPVLGTQQRPERQVVRLGAAVRDGDVLGGGPWVPGRDPLAELARALGERVPQAGREEPCRAARVALQELVDRERHDAAPREVELHLVPVKALEPFHPEQVDAHPWLLPGCSRLGAGAYVAGARSGNAEDDPRSG